MKKIRSNVYYGIEDFEKILDNLISEKINNITEEIKKEIREKELKRISYQNNEENF